MFLQNRKNQAQQLAATQQQGQAQSPMSAPQAPIYTMPAKYIPQRKVGSKHSTWMWVVLVVLLVVLCVAGAVAATIYIQSKNTGGPSQTNTNRVAVNQNTANKNDRTNSDSLNVNQNSNTGAALNFNVNEALNSNVQSGLFGNTNANRNANSNANLNRNTNSLAPDFSKIKDARDKDRDGLTDVEEELYTTKFQLPDSDKDGYVDGTEVRGLFSPIEEGKTLLESGLAVQYTNAQYGWTMAYPQEWIAEAFNNNPAQVMFTSDAQEGEFVEIIAIENTKKQTAAEWYASLYQNIDPKDLEAITIGGLQGVSSRDAFVYYVANADVIFTIVYQFGTKTEVHYRTTFEMMVKSFQYVAPSKNTPPTNQNTNAS